MTEQKEQDGVLLKEIAKIACNRSGGKWNDTNDFSRIYHMTTALEIIAKAREAVKGARLTDKEAYLNGSMCITLKEHIKRAEKETKQAILKALGGE